MLLRESEVRGLLLLKVDRRGSGSEVRLLLEKMGRGLGEEGGYLTLLLKLLLLEGNGLLVANVTRPRERRRILLLLELMMGRKGRLLERLRRSVHLHRRGVSLRLLLLLEEGLLGLWLMRLLLIA